VSAAAVPTFVVDGASLEGQRGLRITEVMPDPPQTGADWEYEWIEVTNVGSGVASLRGMALRDRQSTTPLPAGQNVQVAPGASAIIAGPRADVDADVRLAGPIGNGLGNQGDAVELLDASGQPVDALEYGAGTRWGAPSVGLSIHRWFDEAGILAGMGNGRPTPGIHAPLPAAVVEADGAADVPVTAAERMADSPDGEAPTEVAVVMAAASEDRLAWVLLFAVVSGAFGGVVAQRFMLARQRRQLQREERRGAPEEQPRDTTSVE